MIDSEQTWADLEVFKWEFFLNTVIIIMVYGVWSGKIFVKENEKKKIKQI